MPPLPRQDLERRESSSSKTFIIIFVLVIVFVAFICLFWGVLLPKWQKRHPGRPSSTRFNHLGRAAKYGTGRPASLPPSDRSSNSINQLPSSRHLNGPPRRFPPHPAVPTRSDQVPPRPPAAVKVYNPRTETPFPNSPPTTKPVSLPGITPRPSASFGNLRSIDSCRGPFSPTPIKSSTLENGTGGIGEATEMTVYTTGTGFEDAKDYILAIPEPPALKPRGAGRPPPLTKQLEKFPIPQSSSYGSSNNEMHPNKLFAKLEQTSRKNSTSDATYTTKSERARGNTLSDISSQTSSIFTKDKFYGDSRQQLQFVQKKSPKSARGDFSTTSTSHIHRTGTITRPRTPVAEYRELYERAAAEARSQPFRSASLQRELTPSTEPLTASPALFSTVRSTSTPPTSTKYPDEHLVMLPIPLRLKRDESSLFKTPTPEMPRERISCTPSSATLPESPDKLGPLRKTVHSKRPYRKSIGFYHRNGKPRPAGLNLKDSFRALSPQKLVNRKSKVAAANMLNPSMATRSAGARMSVGQGSSRYSRDTKGVSIARTPVTADFPTPTRPDFLVLQHPKEAPRRKSTDLIRSKIDDWNLHTGDIHLDPNNHAPTLKHMRTHSDLGPRSPSPATGSELFQLEGSSIADITDTPSSPKLPVPRVHVGSGSDDIFGDEHEASNNRPLTRGKERMRAEQSAFSTWTSSDSNSSSMLTKTAHGNAEWV
jgi:hypothetical protein